MWKFENTHIDDLWEIDQCMTTNDNENAQKQSKLKTGTFWLTVLALNTIRDWCCKEALRRVRYIIANHEFCGADNA